MKLRVGIDGGGTTTRAVLLNEQNTVAGRGEAGSSNHYSVGLERAAQNVREATQRALQAADAEFSGIVSGGLGLAGACSEREQSTLGAALRRALELPDATPLVVDEDARAAQAGAFEGGPGVVCIAGTGANTFGINQRGERARADGLGPLLGDRGSGYWIGESTLRAACRANDGSGPATALLDGVLRQMQAADVDALVATVYAPEFERDRVAALVPTVLECAAAGDEVALHILRSAGRELAATALAVLRPLGVLRVAPHGGVLSRQSPVRAAFEEMLRAELPDVQVQEPQHDAAFGAALLPEL
jgi:N-acetylglucosamine kinase-like BadF-type ATPase